MPATSPQSSLSELPQRLAAAWPPDRWRSCQLVVALSGGADSVALLRAFVDLQQATPGAGQVFAAHFNHRLRPGEADADQAWVTDLCQQLGVPLKVGRASPGEPIESEEQARDARYAFLAQAAEELGARYVVTAHTADDQAETVLMRVLRGSGLSGLAGIPFCRPLTPTVSLVRPILAASRESVEAYLAEHRQSYRTDSTNSQTKFTRNWIRAELLPLIRDRMPSDVDKALLRLSDQSDEWQQAIDQLVDQLASGAVEVALPTEAPRITLKSRQLASLPAIVVQQACRTAWRSAGWPEQAMGSAEWRRLARAIANDEDFAPFLLPGNVRVSRDGTKLVLARQLS